MGFNIMQTTLL